MVTANTQSDMNAAVNIETSWGESLEMLPQFTIKEIEHYRQLSGKTPESAIIKTLDRGRKFKNESRLRQWGIPGKTMQKATAMEIAVQK